MENEKLIEYTLKAKDLREKEDGVLIQVYNNASGYLWALAMNEGGTDLGWSDHNGDCEMSGAFTTYEAALIDAVTLVEKCSLKQFQKELKGHFHWSMYADHLNEKYRKP